MSPAREIMIGMAIGFLTILASVPIVLFILSMAYRDWETDRKSVV